MKLYRLFSGLLSILAITTLSYGQAVSSSSKTNQVTAFINVNVLPMDREQILKDQTVIIRDGIISEIGATNAIKPPRNAVRIDARGKYLMPGLVDMHTHLLSPIELSLYIAEGVTTVFDLNGRPPHLVWREKIKKGAMLGPAIYVVGPKFDRPRTAEESAKLVEEYSRAGYDGIKIYNQVSKAEYPALMAAAKKHNLIIVGHVPREPGFEATLQAGQGIAHAEEFIYTFFETSNKDQTKLDENLIPKAVEMVRASGIWVIPTLVAYGSIVQQVENLPAFLANPELNYIAPYLRSRFSPENNVYYKGFRQDEIPKLKETFAFQKKLVSALHKAGVPILVGTDSPDVGPNAGFSVHKELQNLVESGFTPFEALQAATRNSAKTLKGLDHFGTVSTGKRADLILLDANPLENIANSKQIAGVMAGGNWLTKAKLSQIKASLPTRYDTEEKTLIFDFEKNPQKAFQYLKESDPFNNLASTILTNIVLTKGINHLNKILQNAKTVDSNTILVQERTINSLGYKLLGRKKIKEALEVFTLNTKLYPNSGNTYDSLAETLASTGNIKEAVETYEKGLRIEPNYPNAKYARDFIQKNRQNK